MPSYTVLAEHLAANPSLMGQKVINAFDAGDGNIPFLFKVLAIQKALSIQTHPDKETAKKLHAEQPEIYKGASTPFVEDLTLMKLCRSKPQT